MLWGIVGAAILGLVGALWWARRSATNQPADSNDDTAVLLDAAERALRNERFEDAAAMYRRAGAEDKAVAAEAKAPKIDSGPAASDSSEAAPSGAQSSASTPNAAEPVAQVQQPSDADLEATKAEAKRLYAAGDAASAIALLKRVGDHVTLAKVLATEGRRSEAKAMLAGLPTTAYRYQRTQELLATMHGEDGELDESIAALSALLKYAKANGGDAERVAKWERRLARMKASVAADGPTMGQAPQQRYVLKRLLGEGGNAEVHLARDTTLERDVALKMLGAEQAASDPVYMKWFEREAKLGSRLNHPNVVTVYDFGTFQGRAFIAMEFVEGQTLRERLAQRPDRFTPQEVLTWIEETCAGLGYAHDNGLVHRDIKLDNLMLDKMGRIRVLDFGLVKAATDESKTAVISGTPSYMAPELLMGERADERTDIYALGAVTFALVTGQMPYGEPDIFAKHVTAPIPSARTIAPSLPPSADDFFQLALAKKPDERLQTTAAFAEAFRRACIEGKPPRQVPITQVQR